MRANLLRAVSAAVGLAALACGVLAQGLVICASCGKEAKPGASACGHCAAALPRAKEAPAVGPVAVREDEGAVRRELAKAALAQSLRQARDLEGGQPAVAWCYYQNALALLRLMPSGSLPPGVAEAVLSGHDRMMPALLRGAVTCRTCKGSGKYRLDTGKVLQKGGTIKDVEGVACPACKGRGSFAGCREVAQVKMEILQGRQEFERRQMACGDVRAGRALVPAELERRLDARSRALLMTGMPAPCGACQLTGRQKCSACRGAGWVECSATGCEGGTVVEKKSASSRVSKRLNEEQSKKCPECGGTGEAVCAVCKGQASVACTKCDGSGLAARCSRCTGAGIVGCSKCKGTGEVKGKACPECKGERECLCPTCRGEGALSR